MSNEAKKKKAPAVKRERVSEELIGVRVSSATRAHLQAIADAEQRSLASLVRVMIESDLARRKSRK